MDIVELRNTILASDNMGWYQVNDIWNDGISFDIICIVNDRSVIVRCEEGHFADVTMRIIETYNNVGHRVVDTLGQFETIVTEFFNRETVNY